MNNQTTRETVCSILYALVDSFPGKLEIQSENKDPNNPRTGTVNLWYSVLKDLPADCVRGAVMDYIASPREWPPTVGQVRKMATMLSMGELAPRSPWEAWERVVLRTYDMSDSDGKPIFLTEEERRALNTIGGSWNIKNSKNISRDRDHFVRAYNDFLAAKHQRAMAMPPVKKLADENAPTPPQLPERTEPEEPKPQLASPELVREMLKEIPGYKEMRQHFEQEIAQASGMKKAGGE